jgi:hypothetical protein
MAPAGRSLYRVMRPLLFPDRITPATLFRTFLQNPECHPQQPEYKKNKCDDERDMDQPARNKTSAETEQPEDEENYCNYQQECHFDFLSFVDFTF